MVIKKAFGKKTWFYDKVTYKVERGGYEKVIWNIIVCDFGCGTIDGKCG